MRVFANAPFDGVRSDSMEFRFSPSELAKKMLFYPTIVAHSYCEKAFVVDKEIQSFFLFYIAAGSMQAEYGGKKYVAKPGDVLLFDARGKNRIETSENLEFYSVGFAGSNSEQLVQHVLDLRGGLLASRNNYIIRSEMEKAVEYYRRYTEEDVFSASARVYYMLTLFLQEVETKEAEPNDMVTQSIYYIRENLHTHVTMEGLAHMLGLSPAYYSFLFKQKTGYSPREYIMAVRVKKAKTLLVRTNKSVMEIADTVGYTNAVSLTNMFKKKLGMSPLEYRKKMREGYLEPENLEE